MPGPGFPEGEVNVELAGERSAFVVNLRGVDENNAVVVTKALDAWLVEQLSSGILLTGTGKYLIVDGCLVIFHYSEEHSEKVVQVAEELGLGDRLGECGGFFSSSKDNGVVEYRRLETDSFSRTFRDDGVSYADQARNLQQYTQVLGLLGFELVGF